MKTTIIVVLLFLISHTSSAQQFGSALFSYVSKNPEEKIYIHYDKDYYWSGETIWFKAYLFHNGSPSLLSNHFFLQLTDEKGKVITSQKYPIAGATVKGQIDLPDSLSQGYYTVRASTPLMLNAGEESIYSKSIFLFNGAGVLPSIESDTAVVNLRFFPESGALVDGITTAVAFKCEDGKGNPVDASGTIRTEDGFTVPFKTFQNGMGRVSFRPEGGKKYTATLNGRSRIYSLPDVRTSGVTIKVQDEKNGKLFLVSRSRTGKNDFQKLILVAAINNEVVYENELDFEEYYSLKGHLLTDSLPSGILRFTLFNKQGIPLAERLSFINNGEYLDKATFSTIKTGLSKREDNSYEIVFPDQMQRSLSVSVTDPGANLPGRESIATYLLLTSDLRGYIPYAESYFQKHDDSTKLSLDHVMLTNGWRVFNWEKIKSDASPSKKINDSYLITFSGKVFDEKTKSPVKNGNLDIHFITDTITQNFAAAVTPEGTFRIDSLLLFGETRVYYKYFLNGKEKTITIQPDTLPIESVAALIPVTPPVNLPVFRMDDFRPRQIISSDVDTIVKETKPLETVTLQSKSNKRPVDIVNEKYTSPLFRSMGRTTLDNINQPANDRSLGVVEYIINSIRQVELKGNDFVNAKNMSLSLASPVLLDLGGSEPATDSITPRTRLTSTVQRAKEPPSTGNSKGDKWLVDVFLDEMPVEVTTLRSIRMDQVALIKYYEPGFIGSGSGGSGGTIAIYLKRDDNTPLKKTIPSGLVYNGFTVTREFYSPDYASVLPGSSAADSRTTLFWDPNILIGEGTKSATIRFYNNDFTRKFRIIVEGFSADGKLVHVEKLVE